MNKAATCLRELGLALPIGSVLSFVVMNGVVGSSTDAKLIHTQRLFVSAISRTLTIPGVWMLVAADSLTILAAKDRLATHKWPIARLCLSAAIAVNTTLIIAPLANRVSALAGATDSLPSTYAPLKNLEDRYGAANFLLLMIALAANVFEH